jgi:hypothetical protein
MIDFPCSGTAKAFGHKDYWTWWAVKIFEVMGDAGSALIINTIGLNGLFLH